MKRKQVKLDKKRETYSVFRERLQKALKSANFASNFNEAMITTSVYQVAKLKYQANTLLKYYEFALCDLNVPKFILHDTVSSAMPFNISSVTVTRWVQDFEGNLGKFNESKKGKFELKQLLLKGILMHSCNLLQMHSAPPG